MENIHILQFEMLTFQKELSLCSTKSHIYRFVFMWKKIKNVLFFQPLCVKIMYICTLI